MAYLQVKISQGFPEYPWLVRLKLDSHFPKKIVLFALWKPFNDDEKCFLFHRKSSFGSQDI